MTAHARGLLAAPLADRGPGYQRAAENLEHFDGFFV